jgi:hypothetical protein
MTWHNGFIANGLGYSYWRMEESSCGEPARGENQEPDLTPFLSSVTGSPAASVLNLHYIRIYGHRRAYLAFPSSPWMLVRASTSLRSEERALGVVYARTLKSTYGTLSRYLAARELIRLIHTYRAGHEDYILTQ